MIAQWAPAVTPVLTGILLVTVPGLIVIWAGWGFKRLAVVFTAPAISIAMIGASAVIAPWFGVGWSVWPPLALTAIAAVVAFVLRRRADGVMAPTRRPTYIVALAALTLSGLILLGQFAFAFVAPEAIAQRFDNIVHLNTVKFALETANASPFHIGATSDIGFYPNGWHAFATLVAQLSGADVAVAVNAANLVIVCLIWPASNLALAGALFGERMSGYISAAALSTAFGSFPALFFDWGVLYPNALAYAIIPATLAAVVFLFSSRGWAGRLRDCLLLVVIVAGMTLAHPNALLAAVLFGGLLATGLSARDAIENAGRRAWIRTGIIAVASIAVMVPLWVFARTPAEHSPWPPYQTVPQAIGSALAVSPRGYFPTLLTLLLIAAGLIVVARRPRFIPIVLPFLATVVLFVLVSGFPIDHPLRVALTNPWYSDSNRLAALLPITVIPVITVGIVSGTTAVSEWISARGDRFSRGPGRLLAPLLAVVGTLGLFSVAVGGSVTGQLEGVRAAYSDDISYTIVSADERALLDRVDSEVAKDALIIGSPRTGASLAYALAGREVTEKHIFGNPSADKKFLDAHLRDIDTDPAVCAAVDRLGVDYVLDFGSFDVSGDSDPRGYAGVVDLQPGQKLILVDSEGDAARLFRIDGC